MNRFLCEKNSLTSSNSTSSQLSQKIVFISIYALPILGLAGNSLILLVILGNTHFKRSSFSIYVKSMAVSDTFVLTFKFFSYINKETKYYYPSLCTILTFCSEASVFLSVWIIVSINVERTLVVLFPLHKKKFVTASRARMIVIIIASLSILFSIRLLIIPVDTSSNQSKRCHSTSLKWITYRRVNKIITEFFYCYIPLTIVIIGNILAVFAVKRAVIRRHDFLTNNSYRKERRFEAHENQFMLMLFIVTIMFIIYFVPFTITSVITRTGLPFGICFTKRMMRNFILTHRFTELLKDLNFCTNFIIYCISGQRFRYALVSLIKQIHGRTSFHSLSVYNRIRSDYLLKTYCDGKIVPISSKNTMEESQF